jgi:hypothetical protein
MFGGIVGHLLFLREVKRSTDEKFCRAALATINGLPDEKEIGGCAQL